MNIAERLLTQAVTVGNGVHGVKLTLLTATGGVLTCTLQRGNPFDPETEMGRDSREMATAESIRSGTPAIEMNNVLQDERGKKWTVLGRTDNASDFKVKFVLVEVVAGKDN